MEKQHNCKDKTKQALLVHFHWSHKSKNDKEKELIDKNNNI